jgi:hypothetical protein
MLLAIKNQATESLLNKSLRERDVRAEPKTGRDRVFFDENKSNSAEEVGETCFTEGNFT